VILKKGFILKKFLLLSGLNVFCASCLNTFSIAAVSKAEPILISEPSGIFSNASNIPFVPTPFELNNTLPLLPASIPNNHIFPPVPFVPSTAGDITFLSILNLYGILFSILPTKSPATFNPLLVALIGIFIFFIKVFNFGIKLQN
jgi:hypothetical protein